MSVADLLGADAPFNCLHPVDWRMYLDQLQDQGEPSALVIATIQRIADSLERGPRLLPVLAWHHLHAIVCIPWDSEESAVEDCSDAIGLSPRFAWVRPGWVPAAALATGYFNARGTPWTGSEDSFRRGLRSIHGTSRWVRTFRNPFFHIHSLCEPDRLYHFSPIMDAGFLLADDDTDAEAEASGEVYS